MSPPQAKTATVEIAGVAGAGKSTLASVLCADRGFGRLDDTLRFREFDHLKYVARGITRLGRLTRRWIAARRLPSRTELKLLIYLMEWDSHLVGDQRREAKATVLDQGPVYALARLGHADPPIAGTESHDDWWRTTVDKWVNCLDAIIWLDAPSEVLSRRVNDRSQEHEIKGASEAEVANYLDRYRASYEEVLSAMDQAGGPAILRYDTSRMSAAEIASDIIDEIARLQLQPWRRT